MLQVGYPRVRPLHIAYHLLTQSEATRLNARIIGLASLLVEKTEFRPKGYMRMSLAIDRVSRGMWGGFPRPPIVSASVSGRKSMKLPKWGAWGDLAAQALSMAVRNGDLSLYSYRAGTLTPLTLEIVTRIITSRGRLPDVGVRLLAKDRHSSITYTKADVVAEVSLHPQSMLLVHIGEFTDWYVRQRDKKAWPSQKAARAKGVRRRGRPRCDRAALIIAIEKALNEGKWLVRMGIRKLWLLLKASSSLLELPSEDTLSRIVRTHFLESGDPSFQLPVRRRKKKITAKIARSKRDRIPPGGH